MIIKQLRVLNSCWSHNRHIWQFMVCGWYRVLQTAHSNNRAIYWGRLYYPEEMQKKYPIGSVKLQRFSKWEQRSEIIIFRGVIISFWKHLHIHGLYTGQVYKIGCKAAMQVRCDDLEGAHSFAHFLRQICLISRLFLETFTVSLSIHWVGVQTWL